MTYAQIRQEIAAIEGDALYPVTAAGAGAATHEVQRRPEGLFCIRERASRTWTDWLTLDQVVESVARMIAG